MLWSRRISFLCGVVGLTTLMLKGEAAFAELSQLETASNRMVGCRELIKPDSLTRLFEQGHCSGMLNAIVIVDPQVCAPKGSVENLGVRVVVQYIDQLPARQHESFIDLAVEALRKAWPCR